MFQRPQHLMVRFARTHRVFFIEEPVFDQGFDRLCVSTVAEGVTVVVPHLSRARQHDAAHLVSAQRQLLDAFLARNGISEYLLWYYTPMALRFTRHLQPRLTVYDCMDELSAFAGAPAEMSAREAELLARADLVTTGGQSLFEAKRSFRPDAHVFPSSVEAEHFRRARLTTDDPQDQASIQHPRFGYAGVIDERLDRDLLAGVAAARPSWQMVMVGPVVKIDPALLPAAPNIHYLGIKPYTELPGYLGGWEVAMLPFARNESTRFISPTKTPEYLAAGRPVISTSIRDVVRPYGVRGLVSIADTVDEFVAAGEAALGMDLVRHRGECDRFLAHMSWDGTVRQMTALMTDRLDALSADLSPGREAGAP